MRRACPCFGCEAGDSIPETRKERAGQPRDNPAVGYLFEALAAAFEAAALACAYQCGTLDMTRPEHPERPALGFIRGEWTPEPPAPEPAA